MKSAPLAAVFTAVLLTAAPFASVVSAQDKRAAEDPKAQPSGGPTAEQIVEMVHMSRALKKHHLPGTLTKGGKRVPFTIRMEATLMRFVFQENNQNHIINLDLSSKGTKLTEIKPGSGAAVPFNRFSEGVKGTDLTYDDLSFRYLYWPSKKLAGSVTYKRMNCWVVDLTNPGTAQTAGSLWHSAHLGSQRQRRPRQDGRIRLAGKAHQSV